MPRIDPEKDYYAILGVPPDAKADGIKQAYRQMARRYHPDGPEGNPTKFRLIQEAYEVLRDAVLRRSYDRQRARRGVGEDAVLAVEVVLSRKEVPVLDVAQMLYVMVDIRPRSAVPASQRKPLNLALVIDRSTSMRGVRMRNVKIAAMDLLDTLRADDRLALVAFSDRAEVLAPSRPVRDRRLFSSAIASLSPGGGTEIYQGLLAGVEQVRPYADKGYINHVILLTDGRTYGDEALALQEAKRAAAEGISISALGIGEDWNDTFLDTLARYGGGVSAYIRTPSQIQELLREQVRGLSTTLVRNMRLRINLLPSVKLHSAHRVSPYIESFKEIVDDTLLLGGLTAEEPVVVICELLLDKHDPGERRIARLELSAEEISTGRSVQVHRDVRVLFSLSPAQEPVPPRLLNFLARLSVYRLQESAWQALEAGEKEKATRYLQAAATRLVDLGHRELAQAAMLEVERISQEGRPSDRGRKMLRYGTRSLVIPTTG